jgi:hypothetical protein
MSINTNINLNLNDFLKKYFPNLNLVKILIKLGKVILWAFAIWGFGFLTYVFFVPKYVTNNFNKHFSDLRQNIVNDHDSISRLSVKLLIDISLNLKEEYQNKAQVLGASGFILFWNHDGQSMGNGMNFQRVSVLADYIIPEYVSSLRYCDIQGLPISYFAYWEKFIYYYSYDHDSINSILQIPFVDSIKNYDYSTWYRLYNWNIKSVYIKGIYSENGTPLGFLKMIYTGKNRVLTTNELYQFDNLVNYCQSSLTKKDRKVIYAAERSEKLKDTSLYIYKTLK